MKINILYVIVIVCLVSCHRNSIDNIKIIKKWQGKKIEFPLNLKAKIVGKDTVCNELFENHYKVIRYIDTTGCSSCKLKLYEWKLFIEEALKLNDSLSFIFIAHLNDYKELEVLQRVNLFYYPIFYDKSNSFNLLNKIPPQQKFHTFLLDKENKVVLIGDPILNSKLYQLYLNTIQLK